MKFLRGQILGFLVLLGVALPLQGLLTSKTYQRLGKLKSMQSANTQMPELTYEPINAPQQEQSWGDWLGSWGTKKSSGKSSKRMYTSIEQGSPFSGRQIRSYSSSTSGQSGSWWDKVASFFGQKTELTSREIDNLLWGHIEEGWIDPHGNKRDTMIFGKEELAVAKEKIDRMMKANPDYKNSVIEEYEYYFKFSGKRRRPKLTILDKVFFHLFNGDEGGIGGLVRVDLSDNSLNLIKLIQHLINEGATINSENYDLYEEAYHLLMVSYSRFYGLAGESHALYGTKYEIPKFKEVFKELDPILKKIMPEFKDELAKAQKERVAIELDPNVYKRKAEDQRNRAEFREMKARLLQWESGDFDTYWTEFKDRVKFDEDEYQDWLKNGKKRYDKEKYAEWSNDREQQEQAWRHRYQQPQQQQQGKSIYDFFGLPNNASDKTVIERVLAYQKTDHPDALQNNKDISDEERTRREKAFGEFMGRYDDLIKNMKKNIRAQDQRNRE